jgi:hypothetical protein
LERNELSMLHILRINEQREFLGARCWFPLASRRLPDVGLLCPSAYHPQWKDLAKKVQPRLDAACRDLDRVLSKRRGTTAADGDAKAEVKSSATTGKAGGGKGGAKVDAEREAARSSRGRHAETRQR